MRYESLMRFGVFDGLLMLGLAFAKNKKKETRVSHYEFFNGSSQSSERLLDYPSAVAAPLVISG